MEIPLIGLGTYSLREKECTEIVKMALDIGYRHIDTAFAYENHKAIAKGIKNFNREKLFLTTKLWMRQEVSNVEKAVEELCDQALNELNCEYLDLLLIHWPDRALPMEAILEAMFQLVDKGKIRSPGVSNYTIHHLQDAYDAGLKVPYNQVEFHPYLYQKELLEFSKLHGTQLIAYRPFGKGKLLQEEPLFKEIGEHHNKTSAQVILRWILQKNIPIIPKASSQTHLIENFNLFDFELTSEEEAQMDQLNKNYRFCTGDWNEFNY